MKTAASDSKLRGNGYRRWSRRGWARTLTLNLLSLDFPDGISNVLDRNQFNSYKTIGTVCVKDPAHVVMTRGALAVTPVTSP